MHPDLPRPRIACWLSRVLGALGILVALAAGPYASQAMAQDTAIVRRGDAVVTGFAGTIPPGPDLPPDVHPLDRTLINLDGITARIFDLSSLGGAPQGQLADAAARFQLKARDVGHVFGIAFDGDGRQGPPNIYLAATSVFGVQMVIPGADGRPQRIMTGRPGAQWMDGLFGTAHGGGPGSIWKVDGRTGALSLFANITTGSLENSGAGLGALAFDPASRHLYVSDLETGLIYRLALDGQIVEAFDHGELGRSAAGLTPAPYNPAARTDRTHPSFNAEIPASWGFAEPERRVWGLGIENSRLYYSVADGPKVWSIGLNPDGSFAGDARLEIDVTGTPAGHAITSILFEGGGLMYLAQRGAHLGGYDYSALARPQELMVLRYRWLETEKRWAAQPEEYAIGLPPEHRATLGGVALNYGYDRFGNIDYGRCRQTLWTTGEHLRQSTDLLRVSTGGPRLVHGLQGNYTSRVRPANEPPMEAWYIDYDSKFDDAEAYGHIGNVGIFGPCTSGSVQLTAVEVPIWVKGANLVVEKRCYASAWGGKVKCIITVRNTGDAVAEGAISIIDATRIMWGPSAGEIIPIATATPDGPEWTCAVNAAGEYACTLSGALLVPGVERSLEVWVDTRDLVLNGNLGFRNCVTIRHPDGTGKACSEGGTDIVVKKTGPVECAPGGLCKFGLTVTNRGGTPYSGDLLLADSLFIDGGGVTAPITQIAPPLGCGPDPVSLPFSCVASVSLAAGESRTHWITVTMPAPGNYWAQNCFAAADPWLIADIGLIQKLLVPVSFDGKSESTNPSCVWVKVPGPAPVSSVGTTSTYTPIGLLPPRWSCPDGRSPLPDGRCPCPLNAPYNPETGTCGGPPLCWDKVRLRADGACCPLGSVWWPQTQSCSAPPFAGCPDVWRRRPDGSCCRHGTSWINGGCRPPVVTTPCRFGQFRSLQGICVTIPLVPAIATLPKCPDGRPRLFGGSCAHRPCPLNASFNSRTGHCDRIVLTPPGGGKCGIGHLPGPNHTCVSLVRPKPVHPPKVATPPHGTPPLVAVPPRQIPGVPPSLIGVPPKGGATAPPGSIHPPVGTVPPKVGPVTPPLVVVPPKGGTPPTTPPVVTGPPKVTTPPKIAVPPKVVIPPKVAVPKVTTPPRVKQHVPKTVVKKVVPKVQVPKVQVPRVQVPRRGPSGPR